MDEIEQIFQEMASKEVSQEILDIDPNSRVIDLDSHWLQIDPNLKLWRFIHEMQESKLAHNDQYRPILLIHGYRSSHVTWNWIVKRLWTVGFRNIFGVELLDDKLGLQQNSEHLEKVIEFIFELLPSTKTMDIIGHSMGGLVARYLIKYSQVREKVRFLVTLGAAHKGLAFAFDVLIRTIGKAKVTSKELSSRRDGILAKIRETATKEDISITMVNIGGSLRRYRGSDGFVRPVPLNDMINEVVHYKHSMLNKNEDTFSLIYNILMRRVYIVKLALVELKFAPLKSKIGSYYLELKIPFKKRRQRYPVEQPLLLIPGEEFIKPEIPVVIFGDVAPSDQQIILEIRLYKNKRFKTRKIITTRYLIHKSAQQSLKSPFIISKKGVFDLKLQFNLYHLSKF